MADNQNFREQQFKKELDQALKSGDYSGLNQLVEDTVKTVINEAADRVMKGAGAAANMAGSAVNAAGSSAANAVNQIFSGTQDKKGAGTSGRSAQTSQAAPVTRSNAKPASVPRPVKLPPLYKKVGGVSGTLLQVFGGIGVGLFGLVLLILSIITLATQATGMLGVDLLFLFLTIGGGLMLGKGGSLKSRLARSAKYFQLCQRTGYRNISELAREVGRGESFVRKELRKLIEKGAYPQGHLDKEQQCFMITDATYREYESLLEQREQLGIEQADQERRDRQLAETEAALTEEEKALRAVIAEGQEYIAQIRQKNDAIPGEVFSQKLYRMEGLLREIFTNLEKRPEQISKMHRLMNYYLPTTLKLVTAYEEFDRMSVQGEDVASAKREIENTIDTINDAFGELLNKLFADTAMDVTTDAQVLKTMLAQEGLTKDGMMKEEKEYVYGS